MLGAIGAAITTAFGNLLAFMILLPYAIRVVLIDNVLKKLIGSFIGCVGILFVCFLVRYLKLDFALSTVLSVLGSIVIYGIVLFVTKNELIGFLRKSKR